jgi:hypothetical protein
MNGFTALDEFLVCVAVKNLATGVTEGSAISVFTDETDDALEKSLGAPLVIRHCWDGDLMEDEPL